MTYIFFILSIVAFVWIFAEILERFVYKREVDAHEIRFGLVYLSLFVSVLYVLFDVIWR